MKYLLNNFRKRRPERLFAKHSAHRTIKCASQNDSSKLRPSHPLTKVSHLLRWSSLKTANGWFLALIIIALPYTATAQVMNSSNYKIPFQALGGGGDNSTSTNYDIDDTLAELGVNATGEDLSSTNYKACAGYQCLREAGFITVSFATSSSACTASTTSNAPYNAPLGALDTSTVTTAANHICVTVTANAGGGILVTNRGTNGSLASASVPGDTIPSSTATLSAGTAGFGLCVANAANGFTAASPYNGSCDTGSNHAVGSITTSPQTILSATGEVSSAYGDILTKATISTTTAAHDDYAETITLIVTGTY